MSEHEYRERLAAVIATLKRGAQRALRPAAVGVALLATGGCADDAAPPARDAVISPDRPMYGDAFIPTDAHPYGIDMPPFQPPPDGAMLNDSSMPDDSDDAESAQG